MGVLSKILVTVAAVGLAASATEGATSCVAPARIEGPSKGSVHSQQSVEGIQRQDLKNEQDVWMSYVECNRNNKKKFAMDVVFELPEGVSASSVSEVTANVNFRGYKDDKWSLKLGGLELWKLKENDAWKWTMSSKTTKVKKFQKKVVQGNEVHVTLGTGSGKAADNGLFDFVELCFTHDGDVDTGGGGGNDGDDGSGDSDTEVEVGNGKLPVGQCPAGANPEFEEWSYSSLICGIYVQDSDGPKKWEALLDQRKKQGCNTVLLDSSLSSYFVVNEVYTERMAMVKAVSDYAHDLGIRIVMYYPMFELVTANGKSNPESAASLHPDWLQTSLGGVPNVFYGGEAWLKDTDESAWMDPSAPGFVDYVKDRVRQLVDTGADGLWGDVPIYSDRLGEWIGGSENSARAFKEWSKSKSICGKKGCDLPEGPDSPEFKTWLLWRHHSIAKFLEEIRAESRGRNNKFVFFIENYPLDYDGSLSGLDAAWALPNSNKGMSNVWEVDSVSFETGMRWSDKDDFANQITMRKYARGIDRTSPSWAFSYGNTELDAGLVMAATLAVGQNPLECKTPVIDSTVSNSFRTSWFQWASQHTCKLFNAPRLSPVAVLHSSSSHDLHDLFNACYYGIFSNSFRPSKKAKHWWAEDDDPYVSVIHCDHLAAYRGVSLGLQRSNVPFKIVNEIGLTAADLDGVEMLWVPTVPVMSDDAISVLQAWVKKGGNLVVVGGLEPASKNGFGEDRKSSGLSKIFRKVDLTKKVTTRTSYGKGTAVYMGDFEPVNMFLFGGDAAKQARTQVTIKNEVDLYAPSPVQIEGSEDIFVEVSERYKNTQYLYLVNYAGLKVPIKKSKETINVWFKPAAGAKVFSAGVDTPFKSSSKLLKVFRKGDWYIIKDIDIEQFALLTLCVGGSC